MTNWFNIFIGINVEQFDSNTDIAFDQLKDDWSLSIAIKWIYFCVEIHYKADHVYSKKNERVDKR